MTNDDGKNPGNNSRLSKIRIRELEDGDMLKSDQTVFVPALNHSTTYASEKTAIESLSKTGTTISEHEESKPHSPGRVHLLRTWRWELFTWLLGTVGFAANIILLLCFNGKRQSQWQSPVQITTFVAALAQLSQSALLVPVSFCIGQLKWTWFGSDRSASDVDRFDLASRGPDGSVRLLYRLGWKPRLVSLGALATIMLLAFPSFIQQAVNTRPKTYPLAGNGMAQLQRLVEFTNTSDVNDAWDLFAAMDNGLINDFIYASNATGHCPTEYCTWDPYTTLGVSVITEDITSMLVRQPDMPAIVPQTNHSFERTEIGDQGYLNQSTFQLDTKWIFNHEYPTPENNNGRLPDLAHIYLSYYDPCLNLEKSSDWRDLKYWRGFKASFKLSLFRLKSTYRQTMNTEILQTYDDLGWSNSSYPSIAGLVERHMYCVEQDSDKFCIRSDKLSALGDNLDWAMNPNMMWASYIPVALNSTKVGGATELSYQMKYADRAQYLMPDVLGKKSIFRCKNETKIGLEGFTRKMNNVATSLSNSFRTDAEYNSTRVNGIAWKTEPHIEVTYVWLTMPLVLYCIITIFLFATMFHTRNAPPWKSSILALLRCMDPENKLGTPQQVDQYGKKTVVRLQEVRNGGTWQLLDTTPSRRSVEEKC